MKSSLSSREKEVNKTTMEKSKKENNVSEDNVKLLEQTSAEWWDPYGIQLGLHSMNPLRVRFVCDQLVSSGMVKAENRNKPDVLKGIKILDVGCGAGVFSEALAQLGAVVTGLDPSEELLAVARDHLKGQSLNVEYIAEYIEHYSVKNANKYDAVVCSEVLEHIPNQKEFLIEIAKCVKPSGSLIITTPNRTILSWLTTKFAEIANLLQKDSHIWSLYMTDSEAKAILEEVNCKTVSVRGVFYFPIINIFTYIPYKGIHYFLHAVKQESKKLK